MQQHQKRLLPVQKRCGVVCCFTWCVKIADDLKLVLVGVYVQYFLVIDSLAYHNAFTHVLATRKENKIAPMPIHEIANQTWCTNVWVCAGQCDPQRSGIHGVGHMCKVVHPSAIFLRKSSQYAVSSAHPAVSGAVRLSLYAVRLYIYCGIHGAVVVSVMWRYAGISYRGSPWHQSPVTVEHA